MEQTKVFPVSNLDPASFSSQNAQNEFIHVFLPGVKQIQSLHPMIPSVINLNLALLT